ncbi:MAG: 1-acyl-sn-glycerol-3-phosphate acyltransferase, partial [Isosphaeraceae bacterium]|nr:1-acyl-sn-glycerol-3-phosphate acyltransferase [Isosphaeraceae bacterium]
MHRQPLTDQLPYQFHPPRMNPLYVRAARPYRRHLLRSEHKVFEYDIAGTEHLSPLLDRGDGLLIAPNHSDRADGLVLLDLADRLGRPFCAMAAYQIFAGNGGLRHWLFSRLGIFPVDREGTARAAFKAGVEVLSAGKYPLLVFPEGEVYHLADRLTPLRDGAAALAVAAARKRAEAGKTAWIVPVGLKYRFLDGFDPQPALSSLMDELENRFTWWHHRERSLVERIYRYAEGMLALKELEYYGAARPGPLPERIAALRSHILDAIEDRHAGTRRSDPVPVRVKELRRACLDALADPATTPEQADSLCRDLNDLFVVVQLFSYPGDYARTAPTVEQLAEILMKFEEDVLGVEYATPRGPRRAVLRIGPPIDVGEHLRSAAKPRLAVPMLTAELEQRIQALLDAIGPGRPIGDFTAESAEKSAERRDILN